MPDILIRMEMPKSCGFCELRYFDGDADCCPFVGDACGYGTRHVDCPLHELPEHGELVDLDAVVDCQYYDDMHEEWSIRTVTVRDVLYGCLEAMPPVVIPASSAKLHEEGRE